MTMIPMAPTETHHLAVTLAVARAVNTGRRQRVARCRELPLLGPLCPCNRWTIGEVHTPARTDHHVDFAHINPIPR